MPSAIVERPQSTDFMPYYANYIGLVPAGDLIEIAERQIGAMRQEFGCWTEAQSRFRYAPDKWSIREIVGHLSDTERVFSYRATAFARGDTAPLPGFDQAAWNPLGQFDSRPLPDLLDEWEAVRRATLALMRGMPADGLRRQGTASGNLATVLALLTIPVGHALYHLKLLHRDYAGARD